MTPANTRTAFASVEPPAARDAKRSVSFHLTPHVIGVDEADVGDGSRWCVYWSVTPARAVAHLCHRLNVAPETVTVVENSGDIEVIGPSHVVRGAAAVLALVAYGLTVGEIKDALTRIVAARAARAAA